MSRSWTEDLDPMDVDNTEDDYILEQSGLMKMIRKRKGKPFFGLVLGNSYDSVLVGSSS